MTRINCVPVSVLTDKHLMAEYRELPRVITASDKFKGEGSDIPLSYRCGTGHVTFFYNKLKYLHNRYFDIVCELKGRGFDLDEQVVRNVMNEFALRKDQPARYKNWHPAPEDCYRNMCRLAARHYNYTDPQGDYK